MLRNLALSSAGKRILGTPNVGILASTIVAETALGDQGPGMLYDKAGNVTYAGKQLKMVVTAWPASGTLFVNENGSFELQGALPGAYTVAYDEYADDVLIGPDTSSITITDTSVSAAGASLTGASSISAGSAVGASDGSASAPGAALSGAGSINPGPAFGLSPGQAPGAILDGNSTMNPGGVQGSINASADGAHVSGASSISTGIAKSRMALVSSKRWIIGRRMDPKDPSESITVTFDFSKDATRIMATSVSISEIYTAVDEEAQAMLDGVPEIVGLTVLQRISFGVSDVTYKLRCIVTDEDEERYVQVGELNVVTF